jgi:hypothetical protein
MLPPAFSMTPRALAVFPAHPEAARCPRIVATTAEKSRSVNLYGVPDLEAFLDASLMLPASVTADFNFPEWRYDGKGSGQVYPGEPARSAAPRRAAALPRSGAEGGRPPPSAE